MSSSYKPRPASRQTAEAVQRIMNSLKHFEKKLDKLQDDVNYHGQTLSELRTLVCSLSSGTITIPDGKMDDLKRLQSSKVKKATAIQYDPAFSFEEPIKVRRKRAIQPLPSKLKAKSLQNQGVTSSDSPFHMKVASNPRPTLIKHKPLRLSKGEAPRKATTLRNQKGMGKKPSKTLKN